MTGTTQEQITITVFSHLYFSCGSHPLAFLVSRQPCFTLSHMNCWYSLSFSGLLLLKSIHILMTSSYLILIFKFNIISVLMVMMGKGETPLLSSVINTVFYYSYFVDNVLLHHWFQKQIPRM